jgi:hypothetical protein
MPEVKAEAWRGRWSRLRQSLSQGGRCLFLGTCLPSLNSFRTTTERETTLAITTSICTSYLRFHLCLSGLRYSGYLSSHREDWLGQLWRFHDEFPLQFWTIERIVSFGQNATMVLHNAEDKTIQSSMQPGSYVVSRLWPDMQPSLHHRVAPTFPLQRDIKKSKKSPKASGESVISELISATINATRPRMRTSSYAGDRRRGKSGARIGPKASY